MTTTCVSTCSSPASSSDDDDDIVVEIRTVQATMYATAILQEESLMHGFCTFCKEALNKRCLDCQAQQSDLGSCPVVKGACGHLFHLHCVAELETHRRRNNRGGNNANSEMIMMMTASTTAGAAASAGTMGATNPVHCIVCNAPWREVERFEDNIS